MFAVADVAPVSPPPAEDALSTGLVGHTERELKEAGRLETSMGQEALLLARRIEAGRDTGAAIAALTKQRREAMALAMAGAESTTKPLDGMRDELAERRARLA